MEKITQKAFVVLIGITVSLCLAACQNPFLQLSSENSLHSSQGNFGVLGLGPDFEDEANTRMVKVKFVWPSEFMDYTAYDGRAVYEQEVELDGGAIDWEEVYAAYDYYSLYGLGGFNSTNPGYDIFHGMAYNYGYRMTFCTMDCIVKGWYNSSNPVEGSLGPKPAINLAHMTVEEVDGELEICIAPEFRQREISLYGLRGEMLKAFTLQYTGNITSYNDAFLEEYWDAYQEKEYFEGLEIMQMKVISTSQISEMMMAPAYDPYDHYTYLHAIFPSFIQHFGDLGFYPEYR